MFFADIKINCPKFGYRGHGISAQKSPYRAKKLAKDPTTVDQGEENTDPENKKEQQGCRERPGDQDNPGRDAAVVEAQKMRRTPCQRL